MTQLIKWATKHGIPFDALQELREIFGTEVSLDHEGNAASESAISNDIRLEASKRGMHLWRNNVGALRDVTGRTIRFGLANDSKALNKKCKSSDLIGIRPVVITQNLVGHTIGQFVAREVKRGGWAYTGSDREKAQLAFITLINGMGGDAAFANKKGTL